MLRRLCIRSVFFSIPLYRQRKRRPIRTRLLWSEVLYQQHGPVHEPDDESGEHASQPQSWNLYSYVGNNPLNGVDPDGHDCIDTTNLQKDGTVTVTAGTSCADHLGPNGTYVAGTVNVNSLTTDGKGSLGYTFTSYDGENGGGGRD